MFDRGDVDERGVFSNTSVILRILEMIKEHNADYPDDSWYPPEHLWVSDILFLHCFYECNLNNSTLAFLSGGYQVGS